MNARLWAYLQHTFSARFVLLHRYSGPLFSRHHSVLVPVWCCPKRQRTLGKQRTPAPYCFGRVACRSASGGVDAAAWARVGRVAMLNPSTPPAFWQHQGLEASVASADMPWLQTSPAGAQEWMPPLPPEDPPAGMEHGVMPPLPPNGPPMAVMPPLPPDDGNSPKATKFDMSPKATRQPVQWVMPPLPPEPSREEVPMQWAGAPPLPPLPEVPLDKCLPASSIDVSSGVWPWVVFLPDSFSYVHPAY